MRMILLYIFLMLVSSGSLVAQKSLFSNRIGDTVDLAEREYFRLFPFRGDFEQAVFTGSLDSALHVTVQRTLNGTRSDTAFVLESSVAIALYIYVEKYEQLWSSDSIHIDWNLLAPLVRPSRSYNDKPVNIWLATLDGKEIAGEAVYANDTLLVIATRPIGNDWLNVARHVELVDPATIFWAGIGSDVLRDFFRDVLRIVIGIPDNHDSFLNGSEELYRTRILSSLDGNTVFAPGLLSPEVSLLLRNPKPAVSAFTQPFQLPAVQLPVKEPPKPAWSLFASIALSTSSTSPTIGYFSNLEPVDTTFKSEYEGLLWSAGLFHEVADGWLIGAMYTGRPAMKATLMKDGDFERSSNHEISAMVTKLLVRPADPSSTPSVVGLVQRSEFGIGAGVSAAFVTIESYLVSPLIADSSLHQTISTTLAGVTGIASWNVYLNEMVSVGMMGRVSFFPEIDVPDKRVQHTSGNSFLFKMHDPYTISLHTIDLHAGVQFHF